MARLYSLKELEERMLASDEAQQAYSEGCRELELVEQLYAAREKAGLTQRGLARSLGVSPSTVNRLERSPFSANFRFLERYASVCGAKLEVKLG